MATALHTRKKTLYSVMPNAHDVVWRRMSQRVVEVAVNEWGARGTRVKSSGGSAAFRAGAESC